jgi:hypothetical protein
MPNNLAKNTMEQNNEVANVENLNVATKKTSLTTEQKICYILSAIFFIAMLVHLIGANTYLAGEAKWFGDGRMSERYVGGDAYNFIIAGTYSTTLTVRALLFAVLGSVTLIIGKLKNK